MFFKNKHIVALCGAILFCSCGSIDGTEVYALWETYEHPENAFHFHYLSPPWQLDEKSTSDHPVLLLDKHADNEFEDIPRLGVRFGRVKDIWSKNILLTTMVFTTNVYCRKHV